MLFLMTEHIYGQISNKMTENGGFLTPRGQNPENRAHFRAKHEKCPDKLPLFGALFSLFPGDPRGFEKKGQKMVIFAPFLALLGDLGSPRISGCSGLFLGPKWPVFSQNHRFWGPNGSFGGVLTPLYRPLFSLYSGEKMVIFLDFWRF